MVKQNMVKNFYGEISEENMLDILNNTHNKIIVTQIYGNIEIRMVTEKVELIKMIRAVTKCVLDNDEHIPHVILYTNDGIIDVLL